MQDTQTIHDLFRTLRESLGFTQKELADRLQVSPVYISYLENGSRIPSKKLLNKLYSLKGESKLPLEVEHLLKRAKKSVYKGSVENINTVYQLKSQGLYSIAHLRRALKNNPGSLINVLGLFHLYREKGDLQSADQTLLNAIPYMQSPEDRKWLEAYHFQLEGTPRDYERAFDIMTEALEIFNTNYSESNQALIEKKAEMLFRMALIHYDYGVSLFNQMNDLEQEAISAAQVQFEKALSWHEQLRKIYLYPYSQLDYANLNYWLGLIKQYSYFLDAKPQLKKQELNYWETFIVCSQEAAAYHLRQSGLCPQQDGHYSLELRLINASFLALAHGRLAFLKPQKAIDHFIKAEWILSQWMPLNTRDKASQYRFYYNMSHLYSLKAEYLQSGPEHNEALILCKNYLEKAMTFDPGRLKSELKMPLELVYYQDQIGRKK